MDHPNVRVKEPIGIRIAQQNGSFAVETENGEVKAKGDSLPSAIQALQKEIPSMFTMLSNRKQLSDEDLKVLGFLSKRLVIQ